jgi:hypothetical protein
MSSDLVTSAVAAAILGVSRQRVHQLVDAGKLKALRVETGGAERMRMLVFERTEVERCRAGRAKRGLQTFGIKALSGAMSSSR